MNRLLARQVRRYIGDEVPDKLKPFLEAVNGSYLHYEEDRKMLERSMEISSVELRESNDQLLLESKKQQEIFNRVKDSLKTVLTIKGADQRVNLEDSEDTLEMIELIKKQMEQIKEVEERLLLTQELIDHSSDSIQIANEQGDFIFINKEFSKRTGYSREEILEMNVKGIEKLFRENEGVWEQHLNELKEVDSLLINGTNYRSDGSEFPVEVNVRHVNINGEGYVMALSRDITERKIAETNLKNTIDELQKANAELESFAYVVSHDLKAPLRGISSLTDWLIEDYSDKLDEEGNSHLKLMKKRVGRLHNLIEGILQYSKVGRITEDIENIELTKVVSDIIDSLDPPENFQFEIKNELPLIENEYTPVKQIFQNLISNAIKYNDKEIGKIKIAARKIENGFWEFMIVDNGPGIEKKYHEKIFKIFQTLDNKDKSNSTGIGLTIVQKIIEHNKGTIRIESEQNKGSTFYFTLPEKINNHAK